MLSERRPQKEKKPAENNPSGEKSRARNLGRNLGSTVNLLMMWATLFSVHVNWSGRSYV